MAMYEKGMWEREQCEYVETILHILSKAYQRSHNLLFLSMIIQDFLCRRYRNQGFTDK